MRLNGSLRVYREFETGRYFDVDVDSPYPSYVFSPDGDFVGILIPCSLCNDADYYFTRVKPFDLKDREGVVLDGNGGLIRRIKFNENGVFVDE